MTNDLPPEIAAAAERMEAPAAATEAMPADVTGELRILLAWWHSMAGGSEPHVAIVDAAGGPWLDAGDAMVAGLQAADSAVDSGANLLVPRVTARDDIAARTIIAVLTRSDAQALVPQPEGMSDADWIAKVTSIRDDANRVTSHRGELVALLDSAKALPIAFVVGVLMCAAARRTPCLIDGTDELAAAVVADRITLSAKSWWRCGSQSDDPARRAAVERTDLARGLPLALTDDDGLGSEATLALLRLLTR